MDEFNENGSKRWRPKIGFRYPSKLYIDFSFQNPQIPKSKFSVETQIALIPPFSHLQN